MAVLQLLWPKVSDFLLSACERKKAQTYTHEVNRLHNVGVLIDLCTEI